VALSYIDYLITCKQYKEAADWCSKIALSSKNWEEKILIFAKEGKLEVFISILNRRESFEILELL
jgi:hypothetical protein